MIVNDISIWVNDNIAKTCFQCGGCLIPYDPNLTLL